MIDKINAAVEFIKGQYDTVPAIGVVLGSGLGNFIKEISIEKEISYSDIPHFPVSTVEGQVGNV